MATIRTKAGLLAQIALLFPDNAAEEITPADVRSFLDDFVVSNLSETSVVVASSPVVIQAEADAVVLLPFSAQITLPTISDYKTRILRIYNRAGNTVTILGDGDTVGGGASYELIKASIVDLVPNALTGNWIPVIVSRDKIQGNFYMENNLIATPIVSAGIYEQLGGILSINGGVNDFFTVTNAGLNGMQITYIGDIDIDVRISINQSVLASPVNQTFGGKVIKDFGGISEVILDGRAYGFMDNGDPRTHSLITQTSLTKNDVLTLVGANFDGTQNFVITDLTMSVEEI